MPRGMRSWHAHAGKWIATSVLAEREEREETCRDEMTIARKSYGDDVEMVCRKKGMEKETEEARRLARAC